MTKLIGADDHNLPDWLRAKSAACGIAIILINHERQPF